MKRFFLAALAVCCLGAANAQKVKVTWGDESKSELDYNSFVNGQGSDMIKLCFESHGGGMFSKKSITPILVRYNDKLSEMNVRKYEVDDKNISFNNLLSVKNRLFMFTSQYDKETKSTSYYCQPLNIQNLNPDGKSINLGSFEAVNKTSQTTVGYELSKDSSKIMMFGSAPVSKKENEKYYMAVYDNTMKKLWDNTVELPYKDKYITILDQIVTNDGKVGVIIKHYDQEVSKESVRQNGERVPSYKTKFLLYEGKNPKPYEFVLNTEDKFIHTLQLTSDVNNNLQLFGLYKTKHNGYVTGFFTATVNTATKDVSLSKMNAFPTPLVEQIKIDKQGSDKEKDPGLSVQFKLDKVFERPDGSKDYLLEYFEAIYHTTTDSRGFVTGGYYTYKYGDIIDISLKQNGSTVIARIPKAEEATTKIFSNFQVLAYKDKLLLFYNDNRDNVERELEKKPDNFSNFGKSVLTMATIDSKGALTRSIILDHKEMKLTTCIKESCILDGHRIGLYALRGGGIFTSAKDMVGILEII